MAATAEFQVASLSVLYTKDTQTDPVFGAGGEDEYLITYQFEYLGGFKCGDISVDAQVCMVKASAALAQVRSDETATFSS